jgi:periplasmic protein TonB
MAAIRFPVSFSLAGLTTATLFWFLGVLIADGPTRIRVPTVGPIEFTTPIVELLPPPPAPVRPPPPKPVLPPETPTIAIDPTTVIDPGPDTSPLVPPEGFGGGGHGALGPGHRGGGAPLTGGADRAPLPQFRMVPDYPATAKARGIEGWITFRFTVTREGRVTDVEIVAADPPHIWDAATTRAVSNWRYQPAIVDGAPVEQRGVTATYRFELDRS